VNAHEDVETAGQGDWFVRTAAMVGDLSSPFYREERERDVWNEASAVGLQVDLLLGIAAATAMVWIGGATALPYAIAVLILAAAGSGVAMSYARRLGVRVTDSGSVMRLRLIPYVALLTLFLLGAVRAAPSSRFGAGFVWGMVAGFAGLLLWLAWSEIRDRRRKRLDNS